MPYPRPYPLPRRIALVLGLTLVRWARGSAVARSRDADRSASMLERAAAPPAAEAHTVEPSTAAHSIEPATTAHSAELSKTEHSTAQSTTVHSTTASPSEATAAARSSHAQGADTAYARQVEARSRAIRQYQVDRQVEAERLRAERRAFSGLVHP